MDEWLAFRRIRLNPFDRLAEILKRGFAFLASAQGAKVDDDMMTYLDPQAVVDSEKEAEMSPEQGAKVMSTILGDGHGNTNR